MTRYDSMSCTVHEILPTLNLRHISNLDTTNHHFKPLGSLFYGYDNRSRQVHINKVLVNKARFKPIRLRRQEVRTFKSHITSGIHFIYSSKCRLSIDLTAESENAVNWYRLQLKHQETERKHKGPKEVNLRKRGFTYRSNRQEHWPPPRRDPTPDWRRNRHRT